MNDKSFKPNVSVKRIIVFTAVLLIIAIAASLLIYAWQIGLIGKWFGNDQTDTSASQTSVGIPDMILKSRAAESEFYYEALTEDPLEYVKEQDSYIRVVRIQTAYGDNDNSDRITITKQNDKYRAESESQLLIYDGKTLYISYGSEMLKIQPESSTYYDELSVTSVEEIRSMIQNTEKYSSEIKISENGRDIYVTLQQIIDEDIRMEFKISLENGIVTSERTYLNGTAYRSVLTEAFDISAENEIGADIFKIPE